MYRVVLVFPPSLSLSLSLSLSPPFLSFSTITFLIVEIFLFPAKLFDYEFSFEIAAASSGESCCRHCRCRRETPLKINSE